MLGSIITISELIVAMFALRICATVVKYRYNYCIPERISSKKGEMRSLLFGLSCPLRKNASKNQSVAACDHNNGGYMKSKEIKELFNKFEQIACEYEGIECWSARELAVLLGYSKWEKFLNVIDKAKEACDNAG